MSQKTPSTFSSVANANRVIQAWKYAAFVLGALCVFLVYYVVAEVRNQPITLLPYETASTKRFAELKVSVNGEIRGSSNEYLANIALADLSLALNFTPDNVVTQAARFLSRLTEDTYGTQREKLLAGADENKRRGVTQSFNPTDVSVYDGGTKVKVTGIQLRYTGGQEVVRTPVTYLIEYQVEQRYLHVVNLTQAN